MSAIFAYICTKTTADFVVPISAPSQAEFNRKVHNAFKGLVGGVLRCGDVKLRPVEGALANHLLCDGSTVSRLDYPELVDLLAGANATSATLPDYSGGLTITAPTVTQETTPSGTVTTGETPVDQGGVGGTQGGNVPSGGRVKVYPDGSYPPWFIPPSDYF